MYLFLFLNVMFASPCLLVVYVVFQKILFIKNLKKDKARYYVNGPLLYLDCQYILNSFECKGSVDNRLCRVLSCYYTRNNNIVVVPTCDIYKSLSRFREG